MLSTEYVQNNAARIVHKAWKYDDVTPNLSHLHWLFISNRIQFKVLTVFKCMINMAPIYCDIFLFIFNF